MRKLTLLLALLVLPAFAEDGFTPLFNGTDLTGWVGGKYLVEDGMLVCPADGGTILTERMYDNFVLRLKVRFPKGANNGIAIRTPDRGNPAYEGMELQIIDNEGYPQELQPWQKYGSIYNVVPADSEAPVKVGEWNDQEIVADARHIKITLNGKVIVDANLDEVTDPEVLKKHPGLVRAMGHIGFMGHGHRVEFKDIELKELEAPLNVPPPGFTALFNGQNLDGWMGLVKDPKQRAKMTPEQLAAEQVKADESAKAHWTVEDGVIVFDGKGQNLCTIKKYGDFELWCDWKIKAAGDSGLYLRGSPQIQIWEKPDIGSGGIYNNQKNPSKPLRVADNPVETWNRFFIRMVGEKVTVYLNGYKVVDDTVMENYWERDKPIYPEDAIELQNHGNTLWFRNIYVKELPRD